MDRFNVLSIVLERSHIWNVGFQYKSPFHEFMENYVKRFATYHILMTVPIALDTISSLVQEIFWSPSFKSRQSRIKNIWSNIYGVPVAAWCPNLTVS